jgi:hypothetical protein
MLPWQILVEAARTKRIDRYKDRARAWVHRHLPELLVTPADAEGRPYRRSRRVFVQEKFNWEQEWPKWQDCFQALLWLAAKREKPPRPRSNEDRMPLYFEQVVDEALGRTRNAILSDYFSEAKLSVLLSGGFNATQRFSSLNEMWEAVFVSFFRSDALPHGSVCSECGVMLPRTTKTRKVSKARLCHRCRLRKWRQAHPERTRELWREAKQRERGQA